MVEHLAPYGAHCTYHTSETYIHRAEFTANTVNMRRALTSAALTANARAFHGRCNDLFLRHPYEYVFTNFAPARNNPRCISHKYQFIQSCVHRFQCSMFPLAYAPLREPNNENGSECCGFARTDIRPSGLVSLGGDGNVTKTGQTWVKTRTRFRC